jgi:predicted transcriptional regulator YheO
MTTDVMEQAPNGVSTDVATFESDRFLLAQLERVADAMVLTLGETFSEMVIHDFRRPEHSIVWIRGQVTRRAPGGSMSQIGLQMMAEGDDAVDRINYITRTRDGKVLKSSTVALRDADGHVFGAICLNLDITSLSAVEHTLRQFLATDEAQVINNVQFSNTVSEVAQVMLMETVERLGFVGALDLDQRVQLVRALEQRGFFGIRHSIPLLADYLGVSRASIYNYLREAQSGTD